MRLKVEFTLTRTGDILARIVNKRVVAKIREYLHPLKDCRQLGDGLLWPFDGTIYLYRSINQVSFLLDHMNLANLDDLYNGWPITKLVDSWTVLGMVGYSACDYCKL